MRQIFCPIAVLLLSIVARAQPAQRPNILVILSDDHCTQATSCYGSTINKTPNIDRIAQQGMRLDLAMVTNSLCGPSRATLLTGKYSHKNGMIDNLRNRVFDGAQMTFPKLLQQAGYETAVFGKWHLRSDPTGFDRWMIIDGIASYFSPNFKDSSGVKKIEGYATDTIFNTAIDFLKSRPAEKPFFLLVSPNAPHRNWTPDAAHAQLFNDVEIPTPPTFNDDLATRTKAAHECEMSIAKHLRKSDLKQDPPAELSGEALVRWKFQRWVKDYLRCVAAMDDQIGRLLDQLDQSGLSQNTLVIYTSDNGFFLGDHGWFDKRFMYEQSLRVPFVAKLPGVIPAGQSSDAMALNVDTAQTILDFAGTTAPPEMQGRSLRPILTGNPPADWRQSIYYHFYEQGPDHNVAPHFGVRTATHKLISFYTHNEWELYDLKNDPDELRNVYDDPAQAAVRDELTNELNRLRQSLADDTPAKP